MRINSLLLLLLFPTLLAAQSELFPYSPVDYNLRIAPDPADTTLRLLDKKIPGTEIFFAGEQHTHQGTMEMKLRLLFYLYHKAGVRLVVEELPYSACMLMDHYMATGDEAKFYGVAISTAHMAKELHYLMSLYRFNASKPPGERIVLRGVDREYTPYYTLRALDTLLTGKMLPPRLALLLDSAKKARRGEKQILRRLYMEWGGDSACRAQLGSAYDRGLAMLRSYDCDACYARGERTEDLLIREEMMYENYLDVLAEYPGKKTFSQFGDSHVCLQPDTSWYNDQGWTTIACRLNRNTDSPVRGKVCSISVLFYDFNVYTDHTIPTPLLRGIWNYSETYADLLDVSDSTCPYHDVNGLVDYVLVLDFGRRQDEEYNSLPGNDPFGLMHDSYNIYNGIYVSGGYGNFPVIEGGYLRSRRAFTAAHYKFSTGLGMEWNLLRKAHSYKGFFSASRWLVSIGASAGYTTDYRSGAFFVRPEIGLQKNIFQLLYTPNFVRKKDTDLPIYEKMNQHMVTFRVLLPAVVVW